MQHFCLFILGLIHLVTYTSFIMFLTTWNPNNSGWIVMSGSVSKLIRSSITILKNLEIERRQELIDGRTASFRNIFSSIQALIEGLSATLVVLQTVLTWPSQLWPFYLKNKHVTLVVNIWWKQYCKWDCTIINIQQHNNSHECLC